MDRKIYRICYSMKGVYTCPLSLFNTAEYYICITSEIHLVLYVTSVLEKIPTI